MKSRSADAREASLSSNGLKESLTPSTIDRLKREVIRFHVQELRLYPH